MLCDTLEIFFLDAGLFSPFGIQCWASYLQKYRNMSGMSVKTTIFPLKKALQLSEGK